MTDAVAGVSFEVRDKEFVALVGPSGCGKSTVLNMIAGLVAPTAGAIRLDGRLLAGVPREVGYVFQKDTVFPWRTVAQNVELGLVYRGVPRAERERRVREAIRLAGLEGFEDAFPATLSGGMRQRVALIRTLVVEPEILLMDEPFGALDTHTKIRLQAQLLDLWTDRRQTIVFVTHDLAEAITLADRVIVLTRRPGRIKYVHEVQLPRPARRHPRPGDGRVRPGVQRPLARARRGVRERGAARGARRGGVSDRARVNAWRLLILVLLLGLWEGLTHPAVTKSVSRVVYFVDPFFISRPSAIWSRFWHLNSGAMRMPLWRLLISTLESTLLGFAVGVGTGFVAGLVLGRNARLAAVLHPYIVAFNSLPRIALVPLVTMIFGFGLLAKVVLAWLIVFFIVFFNTFQGARGVDPDLIHSARFLGASERQVMRTVIVPSALAWTFASLTPSVSFALIGVVIGEFIGGESGGGIGYLIIASLGSLNAADMMVALVVLGLTGIVLALGIHQVEARLLRWRPEYQARG